MLCYEDLFLQLTEEGFGAWAAQLRESTSQILHTARNGHLPKWRRACEGLPPISVTQVDFDEVAVTLRGQATDHEREQLRETLSVFHPWRKGPFDLFGILLDAEWRSDLKWARVAPHVNLLGKDVLDVGCGNGYYGWRMLGAGARRVIGLEPYLLYVMQHAVIKSYLLSSAHYVVPASDQQMVRRLQAFDVVLSMGVLYHNKNPVAHIESLGHALRPGGQLVLETLVVDGDQDTMLIPEGRYAKMRNVWFIPSELMLARLLGRAGFRDVAIVNTTVTTTLEQRKTEWMTFESLSDFLAPGDDGRTIEGYPAPQRAIAIGRTPA